jgi:hypothetical protein
MINQNKTKLQFILAGMLMMTFVACNNGEKKEETTKETPAEVAPTTPAVRDSADTMEVIPGKVAPGNDNKPAPVTPQ